MPHVTIRLEVDPTSRRRTVVVSYASDSDALPHEHEEEHRALVKKLFEGGLLSEDDHVRVERVSEGVAGETAVAEPAARRAVDQKE